MTPKKKTEAKTTKSTTKAVKPKGTARSSNSKTLKTKAETKGAKAPKTPKTTMAKKATRRVSERNMAAAISASSGFKKLPRKGETQMVAFIRDPHCIFAYWEVSPESLESVKKQLQEEYPGSSMAIRVFQVHPDGRSEMLYEIEVGPDEKNRYLELKEPGGKYFVEVVQKTASGKVVTYARSNHVSTNPEAAISHPLNDPQWAPPAGILEYFNEGEEGSEFFMNPRRGVFSADSLGQKGRKSKWDSYAASRTR